MNGISNAFSLLELDVEDDREETTTSADNSKKANGIFKYFYFIWRFCNNIPQAYYLRMDQWIKIFV